MSDPVLELRGVTRVYSSSAGDLEVLGGADLTLQAGELVGLVGPSGSGKSTLLHLAGLLEPPQAGDILLEGVDCYIGENSKVLPTLEKILSFFDATAKVLRFIPFLSRAFLLLVLPVYAPLAFISEWIEGRSDRLRTGLRRQKLGFIYQFHHLLAEFSAADNIAMPLMIAGVSRAKARAKADELLAEMGLADRGHHQPGQLSGGEQQRVAIARALANDPRLVIADEPTGNLDPATTEKVFATLIKMARSEGAAVLVATHNMSLIKHMDRVLTLKDGKLVDYVA